AFGEQRTAVAVRAERLGREERGRGDVRRGPERAAVQRGAEALRAIIDGEDLFPPGDGGQSRPVRRLSEQIDADQCARTQAAGAPYRIDPGLQMPRVN